MMEPFGFALNFAEVELLKAIREQRQQMDLKDEQIEATLQIEAAVQKDDMMT